MFTEITSACADDSQATGDALPTGGDCKIDVGSDLVVWTKHFTTFFTYTKVAIPAPASSGGGGGGGNGPLIALRVPGGQVFGAATTILREQTSAVAAELTAAFSSPLQAE